MRSDNCYRQLVVQLHQLFVAVDLERVDGCHMGKPVHRGSGERIDEPDHWWHRQLEPGVVGRKLEELEEPADSSTTSSRGAAEDSWEGMDCS